MQRPGPSSLPVQLPEASNLSVPDLTRTQRKRERPLTGRGFFFSLLLARLTEFLCPSHFTEESNYSLGLYRDKEQPGNPQITYN